MRLQQYDLQVHYKRGKEMYLADIRRRHYHTKKSPDVTEALHPHSQFEEELEQTQHIDEVNQLVASTATAVRFKEETGKDERLQAVKEVVKKGWPQTKQNLPNRVKTYFDYRDELVWHDGLLLRGDRVVVPKFLRKVIIRDLQTAHQGTGSTLRRARESVYWPNMSNDNKEHISRCEVCASFRPQ